MKKLISSTAALLVAGGIVFVGCNKSDTVTSTNSPTTEPTPGQKIGSAVDSTTQKIASAATHAAGAMSPTGAASLDGARNAVQGVVEKALARNDFKSVAGYLTKADEDRVVQTKPDTKDVDDQIDAFNKAWKAKYTYDFKIKDAGLEYPNTFIHFEQDSSDPSKATGIIAASHGMAELKLPFLQEGGQWRIDVPDAVDGKILHDSLLAAVTTLNQNAPTWPDSDVDAVQAVTYTIVAAVMNQK